MKAMLIDEHKNLIWSEVEKPYPKDDEITRSTFAHPTEWSALAKTVTCGLFYGNPCRRGAPAMTVAEYFFACFYKMFIFNTTQQKARDEKSCAFCDYRIFKK